jgi:hypothetical protein
MRYILIPFLMLALSVSSHAQTKEETTAFGKAAVAYLTDSVYHEGIEMIRLNLYLDLIDIQPISKQQKEIRKLEINQQFKHWVADFDRQMYSIRREYLTYVKQGAALEFYDVTLEPVENQLNMFNCRVRFILHNGELQNRVSLRFKAAYVLGHLVMTSPFEEYF